MGQTSSNEIGDGEIQPRKSHYQVLGLESDATDDE